jgi:hypothetical protein
MAEQTRVKNMEAACSHEYRARRSAARLDSDARICAACYEPLKEQKQDADLGNSIDHPLERGRARKDHIPDFRQQGAEDRRAKNDPGQKLAEDRRLPEAAHHLAQHAAEEQQQDQFRRKDCRCMLGCHGLITRT